MQTVGVNDFVLKQCDPEFAGTKLTRDIMKDLCSFTEEGLNAGNSKEGYASFCKIVVLRNRWDIRSGYALITDENKHLIQCKYTTRRVDELPYLSRWFSGLKAQVANYLHVIIYTREQLVAENESNTGSDFDIVAVNAEMGTAQAPMKPDTIIRNHLGHAFGGSGNPLNVDAYRESATFWSRHAAVK